MSTKRESILVALKTSLEGITGLPCYRSRVEPFQRQKVPALIIEPLQDKPESSVIGSFDWNLTVQVTLLVRGDEPDKVADPYIQSIHENLMADQSLGGLSMDLQPISVEYDLIEGDKPVGVILMKFVVTYRTKEKLLTA
jgi:hypothetical protein